MHRWSRRLVALVALGSAVTGLAACRNAPLRSPERFCQQLGDSVALVTAAVQSPGEAASAIGRFRAIGAAAPEAIRDEWDVLVQLLVTADDPATTDSVLAERAIASQRSVTTIESYVKSTCGLDLLHPSESTTTQPVATVPLNSVPLNSVPPETGAPGTGAATTVAPAPTTAGG
jgi:hypothetical protein